MAVTEPYASLPGGDLIAAGLADLRHGVRDTLEALLVAAGGTRLRAAGVDVPAGAESADAEQALYHALEPELFRYPAIDPPAFRGRVESFVRRAHG